MVTNALRSYLHDRVLRLGIEFVRDLKERPGGDIGVHASISVARTLLAADVVDAPHRATSPRTTGNSATVRITESAALEPHNPVSGKRGKAQVDCKSVAVRILCARRYRRRSWAWCRTGRASP
jgi:hypothetical protein